MPKKNNNPFYKLKVTIFSGSEIYFSIYTAKWIFFLPKKQKNVYFMVKFHPKIIYVCGFRTLETTLTGIF